MFLELIPLHITNSDPEYIRVIKQNVLRECYIYEHYVVPKVSQGLKDLNKVFSVFASQNSDSAIIQEIKTKILPLKEEFRAITEMHVNQNARILVISQQMEKNEKRLEEEEKQDEIQDEKLLHEIEEIEIKLHELEELHNKHLINDTLFRQKTQKLIEEEEKDEREEHKLHDKIIHEKDVIDFLKKHLMPAFSNHQVQVTYIQKAVDAICERLGDMNRKSNAQDEDVADTLQILRAQQGKVTKSLDSIEIFYQEAEKRIDALIKKEKVKVEEHHLRNYKIIQ